MPFPTHRPRRLRNHPTILKMVRETHLRSADLIYPLFVCEGRKVRREVKSMPGVYRLSVDHLAKEAREIRALGIPAVILFGVPSKKDPLGREAYNPDGIVQRAVREIKNRAPELVVVTDVCVDEYTDHGHCGVIDAKGRVLNDPTLELLSKMALTHAQAGADIVAPSDMMDGRVQAIRKTLDRSGFADTVIMAYSAKYASAYYGPFRDAADCAPKFGDRCSYQMDPANSDESLREVMLDIEEGADIVMVKPALPYLDIIHRIRRAVNVPVAAYNVSGEYSIIKAGGRLGWVDAERVMMETLVSIKRAGAQMILTYFAKEAARLLNK